jgi:hypothetical protein
MGSEAKYLGVNLDCHAISEHGDSMGADIPVDHAHGYLRTQTGRSGREEDKT